MKIFLPLLSIFFTLWSVDDKEDIKSSQLYLSNFVYVDNSFVKLLMNGKKISGNVYYIDFFKLPDCRQLAQIDGLLNLFSIADDIYKDKDGKSVVKYGDLYVHTMLLYNSGFFYKFLTKRCSRFIFGSVNKSISCNASDSYTMIFNVYQMRKIYEVTTELMDPRIMCNLSQEHFRCIINGVECDYALTRLILMFGNDILYVSGKHPDKSCNIEKIPIEVYKHLKKNYNLIKFYECFFISDAVGYQAHKQYIYKIMMEPVFEGVGAFIKDNVCYFNIQGINGLMLAKKLNKYIDAFSECEFYASNLRFRKTHNIWEITLFEPTSITPYEIYFLQMLIKEEFSMVLSSELQYLTNKKQDIATKCLDFYKTYDALL